jgi:addiction module HigA family antidote
MSKSRTTTDGTTEPGRRLPKHRPPTHPGAMLLEEFLIPLGISQSEFAKRIGVSFVRLNAIVNGRRGVTPNTALRLQQATGMDAEFWLGLQSDWELWHELRSPEAREIAQIERIDAAADRLNAEMEEVLQFQARWPDDG